MRAVVYEKDTSFNMRRSVAHRRLIRDISRLTFGLSCQPRLWVDNAARWGCAQTVRTGHEAGVCVHVCVYACLLGSLLPIAATDLHVSPGQHLVNGALLLHAEWQSHRLLRPPTARTTSQRSGRAVFASHPHTSPSPSPTPRSRL